MIALLSYADLALRAFISLLAAASFLLVSSIVLTFTVGLPLVAVFRSVRRGLRRRAFNLPRVGSLRSRRLRSAWSPGVSPAE